MIVNYFQSEITNFIIDTSYKVVINNTDIKIQGALFVTAGTTFQWQCIVTYISLKMSTKYSEIYCTNTVPISAIIW